MTLDAKWCRQLLNFFNSTKSTPFNWIGLMQILGNESLTYGTLCLGSLLHITFPFKKGFQGHKTNVIILKKLEYFFFYFHFLLWQALSILFEFERLRCNILDIDLYIQQWSPPIKFKQSKSCFPYLLMLGQKNGKHAIKFGGETNSSWNEDFAQQKCKGCSDFEQFGY